MLTDVPPRNANREGFRESDKIRTLDLPQDRRLLPLAKSIELAMTDGATAAVRRACVDFLIATSEFYIVQPCGIRVLASRPLRVREHSVTELFGDYAPESMLIRVWTRTAVRKEITSFGTFLSTLCHEFCHHLDYNSAFSSEGTSTLPVRRTPRCSRAISMDARDVMVRHRPTLTAVVMSPRSFVSKR
jgi:hypothetical protein